MKSFTFNNETVEAVRSGSLANVSGLTHYSGYFSFGRIDYYLRGQKGNNKLFINDIPATEEQKREFSYQK